MKSEIIQKEKCDMGAMIWQKPARILMVHWQTSRRAMMKLLKDLGWI